MSLTPETTSPSRPTEFSDELAVRICDLVANGIPLRHVTELDGMPHRSTIHRWLNTRPQFAAAYAVAKELGCELLAETALEEALAASPLTAQVERLRFDARRWYLSKLSPKKWGDKVVTEHTGADGGAIQLQPVAPPLVPSEVRDHFKAIMAEAEKSAGLPASDDKPDAERLQRVMLSGSPLHPKLWAALRNDGGGHD